LVGKVFLAAAGVESSLWLLLAALVIGSVIGVFYYLRVAITIFRQAEGEPPKWIVLPLNPIADVTLILLSVGLILLGIFPGPLLSLIEGMVSRLG